MNSTRDSESFDKSNPVEIGLSSSPYASLLEKRVCDYIDALKLVHCRATATVEIRPKDAVDLFRLGKRWTCKDHAQRLCFGPFPPYPIVWEIVGGEWP